MSLFGCASDEQFFRETVITAEDLRQLATSVEDAGQLPLLDMSNICPSSAAFKIEDFDNSRSSNGI